MRVFPAIYESVDRSAGADICKHFLPTVALGGFGMHYFFADDVTDDLFECVR